jgi:hypothetical protein
MLITFSDKWRALQNIGGIGNVTFIPPKGIEGDPLAFDTGKYFTFIIHVVASKFLSSNRSRKRPFRLVLFFYF